MSSFEDYIIEARRSLKVAEHLLNSTYPAVRDPRLILAVAEDIYTAVSIAMDAALSENDRSSEKGFVKRFEAFRALAGNCGLADDELSLPSELNKIIQEHKDSPVEFARKGDFVICDDDYACSVISSEDMKKYLFRAGLFIAKVEAMQGEMRERAEDE